MSLTAISAATQAHAALFAAASNEGSSSVATRLIDDCGTVVPRKWPPGGNPPPPPPVNPFERFAIVELPKATQFIDDFCGNGRPKFPFPPPPPPWVDGINQMLSGR